MRSGRLTPWDWLWLAIAALYFLVPLYGTAEFSLETGGGHYGFTYYAQILQDTSSPTFKDSFILSLKLAIGTVVVSTLLMVPTVFWVNLRLPRLRPVLDFIAVMPFVVPAITLGVGILHLFSATYNITAGPLYWLVARPVSWLNNGPQVLVTAYVILALPFTYRSLDAGIRAVNIKVLTEAAQSLGAGWLAILWRVLLPNIRYALLSSAFLTFALVIGEYTIANIFLFSDTFATYTAQKGQDTAQAAAALAVISLVMVWGALLIILILGRGRQAQVAGAR
jgi:putative spermidine/putrescine transport system permease protein